MTKDNEDALQPLTDEQTTLSRTIYELSQDERSAAEAAFTKAIGSKPELGLPSDRAWMEGFAAARAQQPSLHTLTVQQLQALWKQSDERAEWSPIEDFARAAIAEFCRINGIGEGIEA